MGNVAQDLTLGTESEDGAMGLSDVFGDGSALVAELGSMIRTDGLADLLAGFNDAGEEQAVESWVGAVECQATSPDAVKRAVGRTRIQAMAGRLGATEDQVAEGLARIIPAAVDALTPGGAPPTGAELDAMDLPALIGSQVPGLLA